MSKTSAGILLYIRKPHLQVLLAHPGGPYWQNKDEGAWYQGHPKKEKYCLYHQTLETGCLAYQADSQLGMELDVVLQRVLQTLCHCEWSE